MIYKIKNLLKQGKVETALKMNSADRDAVKALQTALNNLGFGLGVDGGYGNKTKGAVQAFGTKVGMPTTGDFVTSDLANNIVALDAAVGDLRIIHEAMSKNTLSAIKRGAKNDENVKALQRLLNMLGFGAQLNWETYKDDGDFGGGTAAALLAFGSEAGVPTTGQALDPAIAQAILDKFTPMLGDKWAEAGESSAASSSASRRSSSGGGFKQYNKLYPVGNRDDGEIQRQRKNWSAESFPRGKRTTREYRYEFNKERYKIDGETLQVPYIDVKKFKKNPSGGADLQVSNFFFPENDRGNKPKERIVIHFTLGQTLGDMKTLTTEESPISTAYLLARDGIIYRLFSPHQFAWHLGDQYGHNARSIGIELANYGGLKEIGNNMLATGSGISFCSLDDTQAYIKLPQPYRGYSYYANYTEEQYEGLIILLRYLTKEFNIPKTFLSSDPAQEAAGNWDAIPRYSQFKDRAEADAFKGICTHVQYRKPSDKQDIGPAFDWEKVIAGVTADEYKPDLIKTRSLFGGGKLRSETEKLEEASTYDHSGIDSMEFGENGPDVDI